MYIHGPHIHAGGHGHKHPCPVLLKHTSNSMPPCRTQQYHPGIFEKIICVWHSTIKYKPIFEIFFERYHYHFEHLMT